MQLKRTGPPGVKLWRFFVGTDLRQLPCWRTIGGAAAIGLPDSRLALDHGHVGTESDDTLAANQHEQTGMVDTGIWLESVGTE